MNTHILANKPVDDDPVQRLAAEYNRQYDGCKSKKEAARLALDHALNPEFPIAERVALEDKVLGWKDHAEYKGDGIPETLSGRISNLRYEIRNLRGGGIVKNLVHEVPWLRHMLKLAERHEALTKWVETHKDETIIVVSDAWAKYGLTWENDGYHFRPGLDLAEWLKREHKGFSHSYDPPIWDHDFERCYIAFETKMDAENFVATYLLLNGKGN